jgi:hypothetical protein
MCRINDYSFLAEEETTSIVLFELVHLCTEPSLMSQTLR